VKRRQDRLLLRHVLVLLNHRAVSEDVEKQDDRLAHLRPTIDEGIEWHLLDHVLNVPR
jgi:hypothetical protein